MSAEQNDPIDVATNIAQHVDVGMAIRELMKCIRETAAKHGVSKSLTLEAIDCGKPVIGILSLDDLIAAEIEERFGQVLLAKAERETNA